jgi:foldase protein PrsA
MEVKTSRRRRLIVVGVVVLVILGILAIPFYQHYISPFNRTVITADNLQISMRYFLERTRLAGSDPLTMLESLTDELVIRIMAPQYGIQVTDADIEGELRSMASGGTGDISDVEFNEWYRQVLNDSGASDSQYREMVGISLLSSRLQEYLAERVPTVAEQVHLHVIVVQEYEEAQDVVARLEGGEDFATVAREVSIDATSRDNGGDLGWLPPVILPDYRSLIAALGVDEVSGPIPYYNQTSSSSSGALTPSYYYIFMVSERDSARELSEEDLAVIRSMALELWLDEEVPKHEVRYYGLYGGGFDSRTLAWMNRHLQESSGQ